MQFQMYLRSCDLIKCDIFAKYDIICKFRINILICLFNRKKTSETIRIQFYVIAHY